LSDTVTVDGARCDHEALNQTLVSIETPLEAHKRLWWRCQPEGISEMSFRVFMVVALLTLQPNAPLPTLRVITLEDLAAHYQTYESKESVAAGTVIVGPEGAFMAVPTSAPRSEEQLVWVDMPAALAKRPGPLEAEFLRRTKLQGLVTAILRGRFHGSDHRSFGHQNCCRFEIEITSVLSVG